MRTFKRFAFVAGLAFAAFATPSFAQDTGGGTDTGRGGPVLDNTQPLVTGGAIASRRPGRVVQQGIAAEQSATARVGQRFPLQSVTPGDGTGTDIKFRRELLISVIDTFFNLLNTFITSGALFNSTGGLGNLGDLLGGSSSTAKAASATSATTSSTNVAKSAFTPAPGIAPTSRPTAGILDNVF